MSEQMTKRETYALWLMEELLLTHETHWRCPQCQQISKYYSAFEQDQTCIWCGKLSKVRWPG